MIRKSNWLKRIVPILLASIIVVSLTACGSSGDADNDSKKSLPSEIVELEKKYSGLSKDELKWEYNTASKTIVISGEGPMKDYADLEPEWFKYYNEAEKVVIGDDVTSIGSGAFMWFSKLTEVKLGESVEFIGKAAFSNCESLRTVNFPQSLKYVGEVAFNNDLLHSENGFTFPEGMLYIGEEAFRSAFKENTVFIPASVLIIDKGAFTNVFVSAFVVDEKNENYTSSNGILYDKKGTTLINYPSDKKDTQFEVPSTVTTILEDSIAVTNTLEKIIIPASVTSIDERAIYWNYALKNIEVDSNNKNYKSQDGVLFTNDGKKLICYPIASDRTEYTIPEGTEKISDYAMSQAKNLTEIHAKEGLEEIGELSLYLCSNLKSLALPKSLKEIDEKALNLCDNLSEIRYAGTREEWKKVKVSEGNEHLKDGNIQVFCID